MSVTDSATDSIGLTDRPTAPFGAGPSGSHDPADRDADVGGPQLPGPRRAGRVRDRPATRHRPGPGPRRTAGVRITHIFETHIHNDYVTGGLALARETGAAYHVNADDPVAYERTGVRDGDVIDVSPALRVRVLATPGHTYTHLSYVLEEHGTATAVFSGGSLLFGSTGRPDLLGPGPHPRSGAPPVRLRAAAGRGTARPDPGDAHPRVRQLLLRDPVRGHRLHDRGREGHQPGAHPGRAALRHRASRRAGRLPGLLRAHGPGQHRRSGGAGPVPTGAGRRPAVAPAARNRGSGWSICAPAPPSPPGTRPAP